jgi:hypothetical protein
MRVFPPTSPAPAPAPAPAPGPDEPFALRELWPLVAGPLILGGVVFWSAVFVHLARGVYQRLEVRWKPMPPPAAAAPAEPGRPR